MPTNKLCRLQLLILLIGFTLSACQTVTIKNRQPCFVNGVVTNGSTCADTVTDTKTWQLTEQQTLNMIEARDANTSPDGIAHPPGIFQTAADYGEETTELEEACRLLGSNCKKDLQDTIAARKQILQNAQLAILFRP